MIADGSLRYFRAPGGVPVPAVSVERGSTAAESAALAFIARNVAAFELYSINTDFEASEVTTGAAATYVRLRAGGDTRSLRMA